MPVAPLVVVTSARVAATVKCGSGGGVRSGRATLVAASTQEVGGHLVERGAVLAQAAHRLRSGAKATLQLEQTALGKRPSEG